MGTLSDALMLQNHGRGTKMGCVKDVLEVSYYIAFIILTCLIVKYTKKTYLFETEKKYELLCRLCIREETLGGRMLGYALEVYNAGNLTARNIDIVVNGINYSKIDFIQPHDSFLYPMGGFIQTLGGNVTLNGIEIPEKGTPLEVKLLVDGRETAFQLCTDILFDMDGFSTGTIKDICGELKNIERELKNISNRYRH